MLSIGICIQMNIDQLIQQLEEKRDRRSQCINDDHINKIYERLGNVGEITQGLRSELTSLQHRCHYLKFTGSREYILTYWKHSLECYFERVYHYARKANVLSNDPTNDIEEKVRDIEKDLFSDNLTKTRQDDDYKILDLSIDVMKQLRDSIEDVSLSRNIE